MNAIAYLRKRPLLVAFFGGVAAPLMTTTLCRLTGTWDSVWCILPAALVYTSLGTMAWRGSLESTVMPLFLAYFAIPVGVVIDASVGWFIWHHDRNLLPLEILAQFVLALVPLGVGAGLGRMLSSNLLPNTDAQQESPRAG